MTTNDAIEQVPAAELATLLRPLLHYVSTQGFPSAVDWQGWRMEAVYGGWNGLVYHATGAFGDLAIKFTARDGRQRAEREYQALLALQEAGLSVAPSPVLFDPDSYELAVVVQSWLAGEVSAAPPADDEEWMLLLHHLTLVHAVTPARVRVQLRSAVLTADGPCTSRRPVYEQASRIPAEAQTAEAQALLCQLSAAEWPDWQSPDRVLCRCDSSPLNYIRQSDRWCSVDWENSGWGDAAFEVAELTMHPAFAQVDAERWEWVVETYAGLLCDPAIPGRIRVYRKVLAVWWVFRVLHDIRLGADQRPAQRRPDWHAGLPEQYARYLALSQQLCAAS